MRHRYLDGYGQIDNYLSVGSRLPHIENCVADFKCEFGLCARKGLRRILVAVVYSHFLAVFVEKLSAADSYINDLLLGFLEHLLALCDRRRVVEVNYRVLYSLETLEGLFDNMLSGLSKHLNGHVVGDKILFDKRAQELILGL